MKSLLLLLSFSFNLALVYGLVTLLARSDGSEVVIEPPVPATSHPVSVQQVTVAQTEDGELSLDEADLSSGDIFDLLSSLQSQGFSEAFIKRWILARIEMQFAEQGGSVQAEDEYWKSSKPKRTDQVTRTLRLAEEKRALLRQLFGDSVENDPAFASLFKPLNNTLAFLSSQKQIALYELMELNEAETNDLFGPGIIREQMEQRRDMEVALNERIRTMLSGDEYLEYELRESRVADMMRRTFVGFVHTEQEFRDIFAILNDYQGMSQQPYMSRAESGSRQELRDIRSEQDRKISEYLGSERFAEMKRLQDPIFQSINAIGEIYGSRDQDIIDAYEITKSYRTKASVLSRDQSMDRSQRRQLVEQLREESLLEIQQLVGDEAAESIRNNAFWARRRAFRQ